MISETLKKSVLISASMEIVWSFLTDKDKLGEWYFRAEKNLTNGDAAGTLSKALEAGWGKHLEKLGLAVG